MYVWLKQIVYWKIDKLLPTCSLFWVRNRFKGWLYINTCVFPFISPLRRTFPAILHDSNKYEMGVCTCSRKTFMQTQNFYLHVPLHYAHRIILVSRFVMSVPIFQNVLPTVKNGTVVNLVARFSAVNINQFFVCIFSSVYAGVKVVIVNQDSFLTR